MDKLHYEDFVEGSTHTFGPRTMTRDEIVAYAREFDSQPMHMDDEAAKKSLLGGLSASGWHTCCIFMRMICDAFLGNSTSQGAPGIDVVRWKKPVLAGDQLTGKCTVLAKRISKSRPGLGLVTLRSELFNQRGETVLELQNTVMFLARDAA